MAPLPTTARAFHFYLERTSALLPWSTRVELRLPTLGALGSYAVWIILYFGKSTPNLTTAVGFEFQDQRSPVTRGARKTHIFLRAWSGRMLKPSKQSWRNVILSSRTEL